jgi:hypothetical protein
MKVLITVLAILVTVLGLAIPSQATDRNAVSIDHLGIFSSSFDGGSSFGVVLFGEQALISPTREWALLVGGGMGDIDLDKMNSLEYWELLAGLKYYLSEFNMVSSYFLYSSYEGNGDPAARALFVEGRHRFLSAYDPVSPYVKLAVAVRDQDNPWDMPTAEDYVEGVGAIGAGVDINFATSLALVIEVTGEGSAEFSGDNHSPGQWGGLVAFKGYWE